MEIDNNEQERQAQLFEARQRATEIITVGIEVVDRVEELIGVPLVEAAPKRDETPLPEGADITPDKEAAIRTNTAEIGIGRDTDLGLAEAGLSENAAVEIDPGQFHKKKTETHSIGTGPVFFCGTKYRAIAGDERELTARLMGVPEEEVGQTEYDIARQTAEGMEGFVALDTPEEVGAIAYDGHVGTDDEHGILLKIGTLRDGQQDVYLFDVPRKYYEDGEGNQKYTQPTAGQRLVAYSELVEFTEGAVATSATYYPTRHAEVVRATYAAIKEGRRVPRLATLAYSPASLARVKGEDEPAEPSIAQILGEAYNTRRVLQQLQEEITNGD